MKNNELSWVLGLANDMRARKDDDPLKDLPDSIPGDSGACVIANAFNYDCEVQPNDNKPEAAHIVFDNTADRNTYLKLVRDKLEEEGRDIQQIMDDHARIAPLTSELNSVALEFDEGRYDEYILEGYEDSVVK